MLSIKTTKEQIHLEQRYSEMCSRPERILRNKRNRPVYYSRNKIENIYVILSI